MTSPRTVALLGSTGSIGTQACQIVRDNPDRFTIVALSAGGSDLELLARQAVEFEVPLVGAARGDRDDLVGLILEVMRTTGKKLTPEVVVGERAAQIVAGCGADVVVNGITGSIGLRPTIAALEAKSTLALANKESLIVGGPVVKALAAPGQIVPVDSEHSAIAQSLLAGRRSEVRKLVVTASGGPFRGMVRDDLKKVTPAEALKHPNFAMGKVITTNSATLVNKGLEVIEAHLLFDVPIDDIDVVVHPQQYIHSMVEFVDGAVVAQIGLPTMMVPIALGMGWPDRVPDVETPIDWTKASTWQFAPLDDEAFPAVQLARTVGRAGATYPAVYNAVNEECVEAFHAGRIAFTDIVDTVAEVVDEHTPDAGDLTVEQVLAAETWARGRADELLAQH
ncbi:1-deoxy-D-xylulose-5-phosphate reductoisomerase [Calidifontibacter indicus]|uniref:1-deoxy-D-xylulose 5-phosphate reductoisomerase n=1 Tax=Calidifontibacter indicus TaxID=419650 RepID=A0A3D9UN13_9MICO|nr:1-deoxy-D-xylulose-5-phosphate reductoisomerase [Calidifontibacter indicus]REF30717.1 1-deoxy-D-xylulose 5-phosphate reductoisomerase [Calidifontibacter indicus]